MDSKWPFMLITFGLILALGLTIASLERTSVMNNWPNRRCELPVIVAAMFFKPTSDPRSKGDFAKDNFDFCMKTYIDKFIAFLMTPVNALFGKQFNIASSATDMINTIRNIAQKLYNTLLGFLDQYMRRFNAGVFEMSRVVQYLRMAMRRANAMVMSMLYSGITMFRGMLNTIQFVIKVILIICGILLAIIIILIFVLFPIIPLILSVLGAVIATVLALTMVIAGEVANEASSDKSGFCFADNTKIVIKRDNKEILVSVKNIKIGDELGTNCGKVSAIIQMDGKGVPLYNINGICVSGSHLVFGTDGQWKSVSKDERAIPIATKSDILYCFNTTTHKIPVATVNDIIHFRDWEELEDDDEAGQFMWNYIILKILNNNANYPKWRSSLKSYSEMPLVGTNIKVKTKDGFLEISKLSLYGSVLDRDGIEQCILGIVDAEICNALDDNGKWHTELYEYKDNIWIKGQSTVQKGTKSVRGITIITESGEFIIWDEDEKREKIVRDFTDIGHKEIHMTYSMVASRLRSGPSQTVARLSKV